MVKLLIFLKLLTIGLGVIMLYKYYSNKKWIKEIKNLKLYTEADVDELVNNLIKKFLNYNGSYVDNEKLKSIYQQLKNNE